MCLKLFVTKVSGEISFLGFFRTVFFQWCGAWQEGSWVKKYPKLCDVIHYQSHFRYFGLLILTIYLNFNKKSTSFWNPKHMFLIQTISEFWGICFCLSKLWMSLSLSPMGRVKHFFSGSGNKKHLPQKKKEFTFWITIRSINQLVS